jgi:hypothetical protein
LNIEPSPSVSTLRRTWRIVRDVAIAVVAMISIAACSSGASEQPTAADTSEPTVSTPASHPTSNEATATVGPGRGTGAFVGSASEVPVTFTMPAGWEMFDNWAVSKSGADPVFGLVFMDVGNIYADGCQWMLVDPPPGPTVDDLVSAYAKLPELKATPARDVTVDGFEGKQIQITIPDYNENECKEGKFGIFLIGSNLAGDGAPSLWAQAPNQQNNLWILDVDGTRLVILAGDPGNMSAQDRTDLDGILSSIQIG